MKALGMLKGKVEINNNTTFHFDWSELHKRQTTQELDSQDPIEQKIKALEHRAVVSPVEYSDEEVIDAEFTESTRPVEFTESSGQQSDSPE